MARDNTDQMEILSIEPINPLGRFWNLDTNWRRKDKLREVSLVNVDGKPFLQIAYEDVTGWPDDNRRGFASLWIVQPHGHAVPLAPMLREGRKLLREEPVGPGMAKIYGLLVPVSSRFVPAPGTEFGLVFAQPTVRSSIKKYVMPNIVVEPDDPEGEEPVSQPENLLEDVRSERNKYGDTLANPEMGAILNAVAWRHRDDGWGLAGKNTGSQSIQPRTGISISRDVLIHQPSGRMFDVLRDVAGEAEPVWNDVGPVDMPFVAPVDPFEVQDPPPPPVDPPDEPDDPTPPPVNPNDSVVALLERALELLRG